MASTAPAVPPSAMADCKELAAGIAASDEARSAGLEKQQGAWKVVIPVAVVARYATAKAAVADAEKRRADLQRELDGRGCAL